MTGNLVPRFPDLKAELGLSNTAFGSAVGAYGLGALVLGLLGGLLVRRFGSRRVAWVSSVAIAANLTLIGLAPSWLALAAVLAVAGALDSYADIGANAHGLRVERLYGRSILNSLHGVWSIGAVVGGAMGAAAAGLEIAVEAHLAGRGGAVRAGRARRVAVPAARARRRGARRAGHLRLAHGIVALGLIAAMAQTMEDTTAAWGGVYLREELGAAAAVSGLGFIALQSTQTVGRLLGDRVVTRYGDRTVARAGAALAGVAMAVGARLPGHRDDDRRLRPGRRRASARSSRPRCAPPTAAPERHGPDAGGDRAADRAAGRAAAGRRPRRRLEPACRPAGHAGGRSRSSCCWPRRCGESPPSCRYRARCSVGDCG